MLAHAEGGMSMPDLQALIDSRIPEHRNQLETSHANLNNVAAYCEDNYLNSNDKAQALSETKQFAIQSLASVAYQINTMARDLLDMLELQTEKVSALTNQVQLVSQEVDIHKEKLARREIGALTTNKSIFKQPKIIAPAVQDPKIRYSRTPIDYSVLDGIGHGVRTAEPVRNTTLISRAGSTLSGNTPTPHFNNQNDSAAYGIYGERTATLGRSMMRQGYASDYRVPQISTINEQQQKMGRQISHNSSDYGDQMSGVGSGSHHGSNEYNTMYGTPDRYGTIRAGTLGGRTSILPPSSIDTSTNQRLASAQSSTGGGGGAESPTFPLPPPQLSATTQHYGGYVAPGSVLATNKPPLMQNIDNYGTLKVKQQTSRSDLPPPPSSLLAESTHEDMDDLPPPPESVSGASAYGVFGIGNETVSSNLFDISTDYVPPGEYIEKAIVLYDYEAEKADELTLRENSIVYIVRKNDDGWYEGVLDGVTGLFPGNYVQAMQ